MQSVLFNPIPLLAKKHLCMHVSMHEFYMGQPYGELTIGNDFNGGCHNEMTMGCATGGAKKRRAVKVTGETRVFEEGQLGEAPGGGSLSTYRELCALATEMGQPDLLYKFMDLANHAAALNSSRGAAFGCANLSTALSTCVPISTTVAYHFVSGPANAAPAVYGHRSREEQSSRSSRTGWQKASEDNLMKAAVIFETF